MSLNTKSKLTPINCLNNSNNKSVSIKTEPKIIFFELTY